MRLIKAVTVAAVLGVALTGCSENKKVVSNDVLDLNKLTIEELVEKAKQEGEVHSVGMPDTWANWVGTWTDLKSTYGLTHTDTDMSSAEELAVFEAEKNKPTKDIGDVGHSFGPLAESKGLTIPYKTSYWESIPDWAKDDDGDWIVGYYGTISFITNKDLVEKAPTSFEELLQGDYKVAVGDVTKATQAKNAVLAAAISRGGSEQNIEPGIEYFKELAQAGRIDKGELSLARLEKGEIPVAIVWDFNGLGYKKQFETNNPNANFEVTIPTDGSVQSGYATVINAYAPHPHAAALTREYILSDQGQINLAKGFARPIREDVVIPDEIKANMVPDEQYAKAVPINDFDKWEEVSQDLGMIWQEDVMSLAK